MSAIDTRGAIDFDSLRAALKASILTVARHLLPGGSVRGREYTAARRAAGGMGDSLSVSLQSGEWQHGASGQAGTDLLGLWAYVRFGTADKAMRVQAAREAVAWLGNPIEIVGSDAPAVGVERTTIESSVADEAARRARAERLWGESRPLRGSKAETYLRERGLWVPPDADTELRYLPNAWHSPRNRFPAMVARVRLADGSFAGIHLTFVAPNGKGKAPVDPAKKMLGPVRGGAVRLGPVARSIIVCEGIETGLAIANATGKSVWCALSAGGIAALELPPEVEDVTIAADNDANNVGLDATNKVAARWHADGLSVFGAMPPKVGWDFADLLAEHGVVTVQRVIDARARWQPEPPKPMSSRPAHLSHAAKPTFPDRSQPLGKTRVALSHEVGDFFVRALRWNDNGGPPLLNGLQPSHHYETPAKAIRVSVGAGKTESALDHLARPEFAKRRVFYGVPTHATAAEIVQRFNALSARRAAQDGGVYPVARHWKGRASEFTPGEPMCRRHAVAARIEALGMSVGSALCARKIPDGGRDENGNPTKKVVHCPHHPGAGGACRYIAQTGDDDPAVYVGATNLAFIKKSGLPSMDLTVLDESFWQQSLRGIGKDGEGKDARVFVPLRRLDEVRPMKAAANILADADAARVALMCALDGAGKLTIDALRAVGLTSGLAGAAVTAWHAEVDWIKVTPNDADSAVIEKIDTFEKSLGFEARKFARMWSLLAAELEAVELHQWSRSDIRSLYLERGAKGAGGHPEDRLNLQWSEDLAEEVRENPLLMLDATLVPEVVERFFPQGVQIVEFEAAWPNVEVVQAHDAPSSKGKLVPISGRAKDERTADANRTDIRTLLDLIGATIPANGPPGLLASNKSTVDAIQKHGGVGPIPGFENAHFNAVAGRDGWRTTPVLVVIGQPEPSAQDLERTTAALFWQDHRPIAWLAEGQWQRLPDIHRAVRMRDGTAPLLPVRHHPDPLADAALTAIREGQLVQALGRGRPTNRTPDAPLTVLLLSPVVLPIPVDRLVSWSEIAPGPIERAWLREAEKGGVLPLAVSWMADQHRDLFGSERTAKRAIAEFEARQKGHFSYKYLIGGLALLDAEYRLEGARRWSRALVKPGLANPQDALAVAVGAPLAGFRWEGAPDAPALSKDSLALQRVDLDVATATAPAPSLVAASDAAPQLREEAAPRINPASLCGCLAQGADAMHAPAELVGRIGHVRVEAWFAKSGAMVRTARLDGSEHCKGEIGVLGDAIILNQSEGMNMDDAIELSDDGLELDAEAIALGAYTKKAREAQRLVCDERADIGARVEAAIWVLDEVRRQHGADCQ